MNASYPQLPWFALRVKARHEKTAADLVEVAGYESFLPMYSTRRRWSQRWKDLELPLFPGYLFARFDRSGWARLMNVPGVIDAVRIGKSLAEVPKEEVNSLRLAQDSGCPMEPIPYFPVGQNIQIDGGPLAGLQGHVIEDKGQHHMVLSVTLLQRSVRVSVERENVTGTAIPTTPALQPKAVLP